MKAKTFFVFLSGPSGLPPCSQCPSRVSPEVPVQTSAGMAAVSSSSSWTPSSSPSLQRLLPLTAPSALIGRDAIPTCTTEEFLKEAAEIPDFLQEVEASRKLCLSDAPEGSADGSSNGNITSHFSQVSESLFFRQMVKSTRK